MLYTQKVRIPNRLDNIVESDNQLRCHFQRKSPSKKNQVLDYFLQHIYSRKLQKDYLLKKI
jgi:hypothetical protein